MGLAAERVRAHVAQQRTTTTNTAAAAAALAHPPAPPPLQIADTVVVGESGPEAVTLACPKSYDKVTYTLGVRRDAKRAGGRAGGARRHRGPAHGAAACLQLPDMPSPAAGCRAASQASVSAHVYVCVALRS